MRIFRDSHWTPDSFRLISIVCIFWAGCFLWQKYRIVLGGRKVTGTVSGVKSVLNTWHRGWYRRRTYTVEVSGHRLPVLDEPFYLKRMKAGDHCTVYIHPGHLQYAVLANDFIPELAGAVLMVLGVLLW